LGTVEGTRTEWDSFDLLYGDVKIEVKSSAYLQSWPQDQPSAIGWSISPSTYQYDGKTKDQEPPADCCVFCVYCEKEDRSLAKVLDLEEREFYVVPTSPPPSPRRRLHTAEGKGARDCPPAHNRCYKLYAYKPAIRGAGVCLECGALKSVRRWGSLFLLAATANTTTDGTGARRSRRGYPSPSWPVDWPTSSRSR
jgi:hypothetical protein